MRVVGLIPAREGSKGVPRKNLRVLAGRPLLWYTAQAAGQATRLARTIVSTESEEIAALARDLGLEVPFLRPAALAEDDTPMLPVVRHALSMLEAAGEQVDAVCLLQPTTPLRTAGDIDGCIELLEESGADAVVTVLPVPPRYNPHWVYYAEHDGSLRLSTGAAAPIDRRQALPVAYHRDGSVYVTRRGVIVDGRSLYGARVIGYPLPPERDLNIDDWDDWRRAESVLGGRPAFSSKDGEAS
jgi:CMP-N-acetylneuraminic acid synthetase